MELVLKDRVKAFTNTGGTGPMFISTPPPGYQSFSVIGDGNQTYYTIVDTASGEWEVGVGTYAVTSNSLTRDTVLDSSNAGGLVDFAAVSKDIFVSLPAGRAVYNNADGSLVYDPAGSAIIFAIALG